MVDRYRDPYPVEGPRPDDLVFQRYYANDYNEDDFPGHAELAQQATAEGDKKAGPADTYYMLNDGKNARQHGLSNSPRANV